jgi:hypothetical protein
MNPPFTDGWVEAWQLPATADDCADATGPTQYSALTSYFTVPARPVDENDNQLLFLFLGQAPASLDQILQPVLQWGTYCNNGQGTQGCIGSPGQWTYAAWQVGPGSNINHGPWIAPAVGDVLFGGEIFLEYDGEEQVWDVGGNDQSNSSLGGIGFLVGASSSELWACAYAAVLESEANINQSNCNDWPGGASGVNFWEYPKIYNQNGTEVYPTFSSCIEPSSCIGGIEYAGTTCGFDTTQGDGAFALWF